jgi:hypothetical protein
MQSDAGSSEHKDIVMKSHRKDPFIQLTMSIRSVTESIMPPTPNFWNVDGINCADVNGTFFSSEPTKPMKIFSFLFSWPQVAGSTTNFDEHAFSITGSLRKQEPLSKFVSH